MKVVASIVHAISPNYQIMRVFKTEFIYEKIDEEIKILCAHKIMCLHREFMYTGPVHSCTGQISFQTQIIVIEA